MTTVISHGKSVTPRVIVGQRHTQNNFTVECARSRLYAMDSDGEDDPLNFVRPAPSEARLQATHVARSCKAAIGKALRERASRENYVDKADSSTALDVSHRLIFLNILKNEKLAFRFST